MNMERLDVTARLRLYGEPGDKEHPDGRGPIYICRVPTWRDKIILTNKVRAEGLRYVQDPEYFARIRESIKAVGPSNELWMFDQLDQLAVETDSKTRSELQREVGKIVQALARSDRELASMAADRDSYFDFTIAHAFVLLVEGAEGDGAPRIERHGGGGLTDACMAGIPPLHQQWVGQQLLIKFNVSKAEEKNSDSPSPSA